MAQKKLASDATLRLIDLGCGKGSFLRYCLNSRILNHYIGIDIKLSKVEKASNYLAIHSLDLKSSFQESLKYKSRRYNTIIQNYVELYCMDIVKPLINLKLKDEIEINQEIEQVDLSIAQQAQEILSFVTLIEVIEHLQQDKIPTLIDNVFGLIQPDIVIMTTPNKDFNHMFKNFENPEQLRCEDHVFEYKEQEFKQFCDEIIQKYGHYQYKIEGLMYENAYNIKKEYKNSFTEIPASLLVTFIKSKNTFAHYKIQNQNGVNKIFNDPIFTQNYYKDIKETVQIEISIIEQYYQKKEKEVASIEKEESKVNEMSFLTFKMRDILIKEGQRQDGSNLCSSKMSINRTSNNFFTTSLQSPGSALIQNGIRQNGFELMNSSSRQAGQLQINSRAVSGNRNHQFYTNNNINNTNVLTANQPQILTSISAQNQRSRHTHQYSISNEINLDPEMRMIDQNQNQNEQLPEDISQQELDNIGDKKRKIPKVISLYELYCVFFEISVTVGLSMTFLFIYVISDFKMPPDLILIPWIIWSGKKFIDLARNYKQSIAYLENKFKLRYRDLRRKSKLQRDQQQQFLTSQNPMTQLMSSQNSVRDNNPFFNNTRSLLNIEEQQILRNIRVSSRREDQKLRESKQRQKLKYQCEYAKKFAEVIGLMLYFVIIEFKLRLELLSNTQVLFYVLLVSFVARFLFFRVIKKDFNTLQAFLKSLTRVFAITLTFTITSKIDKDLTVLNDSISQSNQQKSFNLTQNSTSILPIYPGIVNLTAGEFIRSSQQWSSVFWPFWIYTSLFILLSLTSIVLILIQVYKYLKSILSSEYEIAEMNKHLNSRSEAYRIRRNIPITDFTQQGVELFKLKKITSFIVSFWFFIAMTVGTMIAIYFILSLTDHMDTGYFYSQTNESKQTRKILLNSLYLIMAYTAFNSLITLCSHTYIKSWILGLYGIETQEKQEETQSATQSITHTNSNLPQQTNSLQNETSRTNQRAELREEMLDLEKKEFTQKMNFNVKIPSMLVKLSNTYYAKLSVFIKNLVFDGNQVNLEGNNTQSKKKKSRKLKDIRQVNDQVQQMEQDQIRDPNQQERMVIKKKKDELIFDKFDKLPKFTSCNNLLTDQGLADILSLVLDKDYNQEVNKNNPDVNSNGLNNNITNNYQSSKLRHKKVRSRSFTSIDEINQKLEYPRRTIEKKHKRNSNDDIVNNLNLNREARESNTGMSNQCLICCDKIADSVIMDCGHGGVCFDCAIQLCINAYTHNLIVAQKLIENRHRNRNPNLQMKESSCHICRQHISQIYQLETECPIANEKFADEDENQYLRVKDFFINEREFIIYYQYQKKLNEEMVPEEDSSVNLDNSMNLFVLRANDSPNHASRGQLAKYSRVLQSDIDKVIEKIADERRKLAKRFESIEQRAGQLQQESFAVNSSFTLGNSLHRLQESNNQPVSLRNYSEREIPVEDIQIDIK